AGLAGWTKNEGLLFVAVLFAVRLVVVVARDGFRAWVREVAAFLLGLLPLLCLLLYYRLALVPSANYILAAQGGQTTLDRLTGLSRYRTGFVLLFLQLVPGHAYHWSSIGLLLILAVPYRLLLGRNPAAARRVSLTPLLVVLVMMFGYVFVYLTTPLELAGHMRGSIHRVMMHVWPVAVFWFFLRVATPEEALARHPAGAPPPPARAGPAGSAPPGR